MAIKKAKAISRNSAVADNDAMHRKSLANAIKRTKVAQASENINRDEMRNVERAFHRLGQIGPFYQGVDPRRNQEVADGGMIREDQYAMSNCPTEAIHREYPAFGFTFNPFMDSIEEV